MNIILFSNLGISSLIDGKIINILIVVLAATAVFCMVYYFREEESDDTEKDEQSDYFNDNSLLASHNSNKNNDGIEPRQSVYSPGYHTIIETDSMEGHDFEVFCKQVLAGNGFTEILKTPDSRDHGIDLLAKKDSVSYAIQCKCYSNPVGSKAVQEAFSGKAYYNRMVAVVLTNSYFTPDAIDTAEHNLVLLWDRNDLEELIDNWNESIKKRNL